MSKLILDNATIATMAEGCVPYGLLESGAMAVDGDRIAWTGPVAERPARFAHWPREDMEGRLLTPALVDCHTHLIYGGDRAREFEMRLEGASYEAIARAGGGIVSTVTATRAASEDELVEQALPRVEALMAEGVSVVEIKSGYGLTIEQEMKMLRAARRIGASCPLRVVTSWLAAHAMPPEYAGSEDAYVDEVVIEGLRQAHDEGLVDAVDGFCEGIAFSVSQMERVFQAARGLGLPVKLHAEQLSNLGGASLAAAHGALSADHLEHLDGEGIAAMAKAGTVAVMLPGAFYTLGETRVPPVQALRDAGVPLAVATDCNPGSSPLFSPLLALNMACTLFRLTPEQALAGMTRVAALALGLAREHGTLEAGKRADVAVWDVTHPAQLVYRIGFNPLVRRMHAGVM